MQLSNEKIREAIIAENLFIQSLENSKHTISDEYILNKKIQAINLKPTGVLNKIEYLESLYKATGKCCFVLDPSTLPKNLKSMLINQGYLEDKTYDDIWWTLDLEQVKTPNVTQVVKLKEISNFDELSTLLKNTELNWWTTVFGNCLKNKQKDLLTKLYVGLIDEKVISTATTAFYKDIAIFKGAEVIETHRRQGIHTQMMWQRIKDAKKLGCKFAIYQTNSTNIASIGTGQKTGFKMAFKREAYCKKF